MRKWWLGGVLALFIGLVFAAWTYRGALLDAVVLSSCSASATNDFKASCVKVIDLPSDRPPELFGTVALTPDATLLYVAQGQERDQGFLVGIDTHGKHPTWNVPLKRDGVSPGVAINRTGNQAAIWAYGSCLIQILSIPDGKPVTSFDYCADGLWSVGDVTFAEDGRSVLLAGGGVRQFSVATPAVSSAVVKWPENGHCGSIGQSIIEMGMSRDMQLGVEFVDSPNYQQKMFGCAAETVLRLPGTGNAQSSLMFFSPDNRRLALSVDRWPGKYSMLDGGFVHVFDTARRSSGEAYQIGEIEVRGFVGRRIGWSPDGKNLAVIRTTESGTEARIYAMP